jgi:hypothetical protein
MPAPLAFLIGVLLIWLVASGRAAAVWNAVTGASVGDPNRPADPTEPQVPGNYVPYVPPATG